MADLDLNFSLPAHVTDLAKQVKTFVQDKIVPYEKDPRWTSHGPTDELRRELIALAKQAGVFGPHIPEEYGWPEAVAYRARRGVHRGRLFDAGSGCLELRRAR